MKVEGPGKSGASKGVSKPGANRSADRATFSGLIGETEAASEAKPQSGVMSISGIDALLSLQEADTATEGGTRKARAHAVDLLDQLDRIRVGLLTGSIPASALQQLSTLIAQRRDTVMDPGLREILDDIDLRAQVELAKFQRK